MDEKFKAEGREFAKFLRSIEQFIQTVKGRNNSRQQNDFLTCSWRFLRCNKLEKLILKLEKILGFRNMLEKLENLVFICFLESIHYIWLVLLQSAKKPNTYR